ncbi:MAG: polysaccharide biosynthesis protein [Candidatus Pacearchaeota archaeon]|nr:MAG: polysaccharide biosynthesis protein [Candidatus Pacearchaeota archaeon]
MAIKNSIFQFSTIFIGKIGSLIFTIIIARLLMPELFGLYNLALATILLFTAISNLGIGETLIRFVSKSLGEKNKKKAKAYLVYFGKIKIFLTFIAILILVFSAKFISETHYQKPLFLSLIAGSLYILFFEIVTFFGFILQASNDFKGIFHKEIIFQISKIILVPLIVLFSLKYSLPNEIILFYLILGLTFSYFITAVFMFFVSFKRVNFIKTKKEKLNSRQTKQANRFLSMTAFLILSGMFFSYIDKIMLGRFVSVEFIGYYSAALGLVGALSSLIGFGGVLLPIFSRIKDKKLEQSMKKSIRIVLILGILLFIFTLLFAPLIILIAYGSNYNPSTNILRLLSLLIIILPLIGIYSSYFTSQGKPQIVVKLLILSTLINVILNYFLITSLLEYGGLLATFGAGIATLISQFFYLGGLIYSKRK